MNNNKNSLVGKQDNISTIIIIGILLLFLSGLPINSFATTTKKQKKSNINATIAKYEPALAIRGSGCLTCHAKINSTYITDFGFGSSHFFGNPDEGNKVGPFNGQINGDFTAGGGKTSWLTAEFQKDIIVPQASLDFDLTGEAETTLKDISAYREALKADSLAKYLEALEKQKSRPATVIEKKKVFIGAPDTATLEARFGITQGDAVDFKYIKNNQSSSPDIKGITLSESKEYYTNTTEIVCDGDLFIRGNLFLNKASIVTNTGCRIYATGPVFLQDKITFKGTDKNDNYANLQLVSSEAIFLGVGRKKCNTTTNTDPLSLRLLKTPSLPSMYTRTSIRDNILPQALVQKIYNKATLIPLEDSTCHDDSISFSRLLLNAPIVHSRYSGKFKGLVIAEYALFWQGKCEFEFDPVFKEVPVLSVLKDEDYLMIK